MIERKIQTRLYEDLTLEEEGAGAVKERKVEEERKQELICDLYKTSSRRRPQAQQNDDIQERLHYLFTHENMDRIRFSEDNMAFKVRNNDTDTEKTFRGLTRALHDVFWPDYAYQESIYDATPRLKTKSSKGKKRGGGLMAAQRNGLSRGTRTHRQLEDYVNMPIEEFLRENGKTLDVYTSKAIVAFREWELVPLRAEVPVFDEATQVATSIDTLCMDKSGALVLVEVKTGFDNYLMRGSGPMKGPLQFSYSNSPLNQAFLQALFSNELMNRCYGISADHIYVVNIGKTGITASSVPKDLRNSSKQLYEYFGDKLKQAKEKRARETEKQRSSARRKAEERARNIATLCI